MARTDLILAIDQGTTGSTCLLVDTQLRVIARATREFPQHFPRPGWVEHDPDELWRSVLFSIGDVLATAEVQATDIAAIGITNQRETSLVWERATGEPIHRALVWQDRRTSDTCERLRGAGHEAMVQSQTGLVLDPYFSGTKLAWILDHVDGARDAARRGALAAGTIDTYLLWRLTGGREHATEPSNASRTMLWPLRARAGRSSDGSRVGWDPALAELLDVPTSILPEVRPCTAEFGRTRGVPGLPDGIPIHGMAGDQQAALFGQACVLPGEAKCTYGTGAFVMLNTGAELVPSAHGLLTTVGWQIGDQVTYCLEGSAFMAGAVVQWLRDGLGVIASSADVEALACSVPDAAGVILVPAHAGLGAPHWRADARGLLCGLTRGTTKAHVARAALDGIAHEVTDLIEAMNKDVTASGGRPLARLRVDGGAAANDLLMQTQADLLEVELDRPAMLETTALGAVFLAGLGVGLWRDTDALRGAWRLGRSFKPAADAARIRAARAAWASAVTRA